ncbi:hypothetical protein STAL104432_04965 [Streptomyces albus]
MRSHAWWRRRTMNCAQERCSDSVIGRRSPAGTVSGTVVGTAG